MRISQQARRETRERIVDQARLLFDQRGFAAATTRDLAAAAGIAVGTLFNYFASKEALGSWILARAAAQGTAAFRRERRAGASLEEDLFAHVAAGLRELEPCRRWAGEVLESSQSPLRWTASGDPGAGEDLRADHVEVVADLLAEHGLAAQRSPLNLHLYWSLYLGVLSFWERDDTPHHEETLALLDRSLRLFVRSLRDGETS